MNLTAATRLLSAATVSAVDHVFEGGGERFSVQGDRLEDAEPYSTQRGEAVLFRLNASDAEAFAEITGRLIGKPVAISVCGRERARPVAQERIAGGSGMFTVEDAEMAQVLAALRGVADCPAIAE